MLKHLVLIGSGNYGEFAKQVVDDFDVAFSTLSGRETYEAIQKGKFDFTNQPATHVYIATPNFTHFALVKAALQAKKHVLCEKPLALSAEEVDELYALAQKNDCYLGVGFVLPHHPFYIWLKAAQKEFGPITRMEVHNHATEGDLDPEWYWDKKLSGGWFMVAEIHWYQLYYWWTEDFTSKKVAAGEHQTKDRTDSTWSMLFRGLHDAALTVYHNLNATHQTYWTKVEIQFANGTQAVIDDWVPQSLRISEPIQPNFPDYITGKDCEFSDSRSRDERYQSFIRHNIESLLASRGEDPKSIIEAHKTALLAQQNADKKE